MTKQRKLTVLLRQLIALGGVFLLSNPLVAQNNTESVSTDSLRDGISLNDVVSITIEKSPNIMLQALTVEAARAGEQIQDGFFDVNVNASATGQHQRKPALLNPMGGRLDQEAILLSTGLSKLFRTGVLASVAVNVNRVDIVRTNTDPARDTSGLMPILNQSGVKFTLMIPLLKGAGEVSAAANEKAAILQRQAAEMGYQHFIANTLLNSISAYWDYKAALEKLSIERAAQARVEQGYRNINNFLATSGQESQLRERFAAELARLEAYIYDKKGRSIKATQDVENAKLALANTIGIPAAEAASLGLPTDEFPKGGWDRKLAEMQQLNYGQHLLQLALQNRADLKAAKLNQEAEMVKQEKARKDLNPTLNLSLSAGYEGLATGNDTSAYFESFNTRVHGADTSATLIFNYPICNNVAKGQLQLANANYQRASLQASELTRGVGLQLNGALGKTMQNINEATQQQSAVTSYEQTLNSLTANMNLSNNPLAVFQWTDNEEKLNQAYHGLIHSLTELAKQIAQLRFQTGTLVFAEGETGSVSLQTITELPQ